MLCTSKFKGRDTEGGREGGMEGEIGRNEGGGVSNLTNNVEIVLTCLSYYIVMVKSIG